MKYEDFSVAVQKNRHLFKSRACMDDMLRVIQKLCDEANTKKSATTTIPPATNQRTDHTGTKEAWSKQDDTLLKHNDKNPLL